MIRLVKMSQLLIQGTLNERSDLRHVCYYHVVSSKRTHTREDGKRTNAFLISIVHRRFVDAALLLRQFMNTTSIQFWSSTVLMSIIGLNDYWRGSGFRVWRRHALLFFELSMYDLLGQR
ncbi:hypothetical protein M758_1G089500 [Ceratodon purpureus]|nr:hypothetical protein M758_1G089500 [Ceratodon purpureus]